MRRAASRAARAAATAAAAQPSRGLSRSFCAAAQPPPPRSTSGGPVSWTSLGLVALTGAGIVAYYNYEKQRRVEALLARSQVKSAGKAALGGAWTLVDARTGKPFSSTDLRGAFALLYFGFTHCPDVCPDELVKMAEAVDAIEKQTGHRVQPVFISIDPARDSVAQMRSYVKEFHPRLLGLTGSEEQCTAAARAFRVYHHRTDDSKDYLVDHSIIIYLLDPAGDFVTFYGKNVGAQQLAEQVGDHVKRWTASSGAKA